MSSSKTEHIARPKPVDDVQILYADDHLLFVNKPYDLLSVPGRGPENKDCLVHRLQDKYPTVRIVHRLDCATSGVMVLALDADTHRHLSRQFQDRQTAKRYIANVYGKIEEQEGSVDLPLRCDWENRPRQMVDYEQGKKALTHWRILATEKNLTRVELTPITGRSHQLRVHMQQIGHPILGDRFYAHQEALAKSPRLQLHAAYLEVTHPNTSKRLGVKANCAF